MCLALSVPTSRETPFRKPRILTKLSVESNSSDYLAFPVYDFSLGKFSDSCVVLHCEKMSNHSHALSIKSESVILILPIR